MAGRSAGDMPMAYRPYRLAYNLGRSGRVTSTFGKGDVPPFDILRSWIAESYRAVAPKRLTKLLHE